MSADAKAWMHKDGTWHAIHDGDCGLSLSDSGHDAIAHELVALLESVAACLEVPALRWVLYVYPDGTAGLKGYIT